MFESYKKWKEGASTYSPFYFSVVFSCTASSMSLIIRFSKSDTTDDLSTYSSLVYPNMI